MEPAATETVRFKEEGPRAPASIEIDEQPEHADAQAPAGAHAHAPADFDAPEEAAVRDGGGQGVRKRGRIKALGMGVSWREKLSDEKDITPLWLQGKRAGDIPGGDGRYFPDGPDAVKHGTSRVNVLSAYTGAPSAAPAPSSRRGSGGLFTLASGSAGASHRPGSAGGKGQAAGYAVGRGKSEQLVVAVHTAEGLPQVAAQQGSYVKVTVMDALMGARSARTMVKVKTRAPQWHEEMIFPVRLGQAVPVVVSLSVNKRLFFGQRADSQLLGTASVNLHDKFDFLRGGEGGSERGSSAAGGSRPSSQGSEVPFLGTEGVNLVAQCTEEDLILLRDDGTVAGGRLRVSMRWEAREAFDFPWVHVLACLGVVAVIVAVVAVSVMLTMPPCGPGCRGGWVSEAAAIEARADAALAALGGRLWLMGGITNTSTYIRSVESFSADGGWREERSMGRGRSRFGAFVSGGAILAVGGVHETEVEIVTGEPPGPPLPPTTPRNGVQSVEVQGQACIVGERGGKGLGAASLGGTFLFSQGIECASLAGAGPWFLNTTLPSERLLYATCAYHGALAVLGGWAHGPLATVEIWDGLQWRTAPDLPTPRYSLAAAEYSGRLFALGGSDAYGSLQVVESFDGAAWREEVPLSVPRQRLMAIDFGGRLFVVGGVSLIRGERVYWWGVESFGWKTDSVESLSDQALGDVKWIDQ